MIWRELNKFFIENKIFFQRCVVKKTKKLKIALENKTKAIFTFNGICYAWESKLLENCQIRFLL